MGFVRVRGRSLGDPLHEYDVPEAEAARHPDLYEVIDPDPVPRVRPPRHVAGVVEAAPVAPLVEPTPVDPAGETPKPPRRRAASKPKAEKE